MIVARLRWVLGVSLLGCLAAVLVALASGTASEAGTAPKAPKQRFPAPVRTGEVVGMRTATSRTYRKPDGTYQARIWTQPVNFRSGGRWKAIDAGLRRTPSGTLETTATPAGIALPGRLAQPAKLSGDARWVSFRLLGADGAVTPATAGSTATYRGALDGVDVALDAQATGIKETLTLADASAPASYRYAIGASAGLTPTLRPDGTVAFLDAGGTTRFWLPAPTVQPAGAQAPSGEHVSYRLSDDRRTLTLAVDPAWLAHAAFPLRIDPTAYWGDDVSCTLASGTLANHADCGGTTLKVGHDATHEYRSALRFPDISEDIPQDASVTHAYLGMYFGSQSDPDAISDVTATGSAKLIKTGATWNNYDTIHHWASAGGDVVGDPQAETSSLYPEFADGWVAWDVSRLAASWLRDPATNKGLVLKATAQSADSVLALDGHDAADGGPNIAVDFVQHTGYEADQTFESLGFDGTSRIAVNPASGNVAVDSTDIHLPGAGGLDLDVKRTFDGKALGDGRGMFASAWFESIDNASFVNARTWWNDARVIYANGHAAYRFDRDYAHDTASTHAYLSPPNLDATLVTDTDTGESTLTFAGGTVWTYADSYDGEQFVLKRISDAAGHHIDLAPVSWRPDRIGTITDSNGAVLTFHYGAADQVTEITDTSGHHWKYRTHDVDGHTRLIGFETPDHRHTWYHYNDDLLPDTWDNLIRVDDPSGQRFSLEYGSDGDWSQVTKVTQDFGTADPDDVTTFKYHPDSDVGAGCDDSAFGRTVMTDEQSRETTYCYNISDQVTQALRPWDTTPPTPAPSGPWADLAGDYSDGVAPSSVTLGADDDASGVQRVSLEEVGAGESGASTATCTPTPTLPNLCPPTYSATLVVPTAGLAEGVHTFHEVATDLAGNTATSADWMVAVDRTAPVYTQPLTASYRTSDPGTSWISWSAPDDPDLPDGAAGSGVLQYSVNVAGGGWQAASTNGIQVPELTGTVSIQVRAYDRVGNLSAVSTASAAAAPVDPEDAIALDVTVPQPGEEDIDGPLTPDQQAELDQILGDEEAARNGTDDGWLEPGPAPRATYPPNGFNNLPFTCAGDWAPIQAHVSGFVLGNCEGGTAVLGWKSFVSKVGDPTPGAPSEGRGWEAVSLPAEAHFDACGWINIKNRLDNAYGTPPENRCADPDLNLHPPDFEFSEYIKQYTGTRVAGADAPVTPDHGGLYVWGRRIQGHETAGKQLEPHFASSSKTCTAYANINPYKTGQQVRESERMWAVHDGSTHIRIRYIAKHRARTEAGDLNWWVMTHSTDESDTEQPWGFVSAECLFSD